MSLSQLFWGVLQRSKSKLVHIYEIQLCWSVKTLENVSLYFCQLKKDENIKNILKILTNNILQNVPTFSDLG